MQSLNANISPYQEAQCVPRINWKVEFKLPGGTTYDVSERLKNQNPGIIDTADYMENLSYINECSLTLDNSDSFLTADDGSGLLDVDPDTLIEVFISGYFDVKNGSNYPLKKFGGWLDLTRLKESFIKKHIEVTAYSYFGLLDKTSGKLLCKQYLDSHGLILNETGLWLTDAAIADYELLCGVHSIDTRIDNNVKQVSLDSGDWVSLTQERLEVTLINYDGTQKVKVFYGTTFTENAKSIVIQKTFGSQYPYTLINNISSFSLIQKIFQEVLVPDNNIYISEYKIRTYDDRYVVSRYDSEYIGPENNEINCLASDGAHRLWFAYHDRLYERNMATNVTTLLSRMQNEEFKKLQYLSTQNVLIFWTSPAPNPGLDNSFCRIGKVAANGTVTTLYSKYMDSGLTINASIFLCFQWSGILQKFIFMNQGNEGIYSLDLSGSIISITTIVNLQTQGTNWIWESNGDVYFYFLLIFSSPPNYSSRLYRIKFDGSWGAPEFLCDWFYQYTANNLNIVPYVFKAKNEVLLFNELNNPAIPVLLTLDDHVFHNCNVNNYTIATPFEFDGKLWVYAIKSNPDEYRIGHFEDEYDLQIDSDEIKNTTLPYNADHKSYYPQRICFLNETPEGDVLVLVAGAYNILSRWSNYVIPVIDENLDFTSVSMRDVLQRVANEFLGYISINYNRVARYCARGTNKGNGTFTVKKDYIKDRIRERLYSETHELIVLTKNNITGQYGTANLNKEPFTLQPSFIPDEILKDVAKYFWDYYQVARKLLTITYLPTFYNYDTLDGAALTELGVTSPGIIHKVAPDKASCEFEILIEESGNEQKK